MKPATNRTQSEFRARGERAWQAYLRTRESRPATEVFDRIQQRIDKRRQELTHEQAGPASIG